MYCFSFLDITITFDGNEILRRWTLTCNASGTNTRAPDSIHRYHQGKSHFGNRVVITTKISKYPGLNLISTLTAEQGNTFDAGVYVCSSVTCIHNRVVVDTAHILVPPILNDRDAFEDYKQ